MSNPITGPLDGIRVLDASQMMAGPLCAMRLGDLGADVLKIEPPNGGDYARTHPIADAMIGGESTAFLALNRNKRGVTINLKHEAGREVLYDLVRESDVFLQNYRVGTAERLGVGYEQLQALNPRLIYCAISGYGEAGPYRHYPGQDLIVQAYSGSMWSVGSSTDPPQPGAFWAADAMTAYQAAIGVLGALFARERSGQGQKVAVNMLATVMDAQVQELTTHLNLGLLPRRREEPAGHAWLPAPYGVHPTADGYIAIAMAPLHVLGECLDSERLRQMTNWSDGATHADEVNRLVRALLPRRTTAVWLELFASRNIWAAPVYSYADLSADPHVQATGMVVEVTHPAAGTLRMPDVPIRLSATPAAVRRAAPMLGADTDAVLRERLGYDSERIERLKAAGTI